MAKTGDWAGATSAGSGVPTLSSEPAGIPASQGSDVPGTVALCAGTAAIRKNIVIANKKDALVIVNLLLIIILLNCMNMPD
jgi:hypothetical protein